MDTITLPRDLYSDRRDDEDRVFVTGPTLEAAARLWIAQDSTHRNIDARYQDDAPTYALTWQGERCQALTIVSPDEDMEQLYLVDELPFFIVASLFAIGDIVKHHAYPHSEFTVRDVMVGGSILAKTPACFTITTPPSSLTFVRSAAEQQARLDSTRILDPHTALQHVVTFPEGTNIVTIDRLIAACVAAGATATPVEPR